MKTEEKGEEQEKSEEKEELTGAAAGTEEQAGKDLLSYGPGGQWSNQLTQSVPYSPEQ